MSTRTQYAKKILRVAVGSVIRAPFLFVMLICMMFMIVGMFVMILGMFVMILLMFCGIVCALPLGVVWVGLFLLGLLAPKTSTRLRDKFEVVSLHLGDWAFSLLDGVFGGLDRAMDGLDWVVDFFEGGLDRADNFIDRLLPA